MENKPIAFFFGSGLKKLDTHTQTISEVNVYDFSVNRVYMVDEPVTLIAGDKDSTGNIDLSEKSLFITLQRYDRDKGEYKYYRVPIHSEELIELLTDWKKEYEEDKNNEKNSRLSDCSCMVKDCNVF